MQESEPVSEEKFWAVLCHLSALAFGMGLFLPVVAWVESRRKSKYIAFQSLQAYGYQSLGYTVWMLLYLLFFVVIFIALFVIALVRQNAAQNELITRGFAILITVASLGILGVYLLFPVIAAVMCARGSDYRYPVLGNRLAKFLPSDDALNEVRAECWVAAMGHFAVIIPLWGLLGPLYLWVTGGKQSQYLKIQSAQTTIYQILVNILYFFGAFIGLALFLLSTLLLASAEMLGIWGLVLLMALLCIFGLFALFVPMFHILGQWAGLRLLQGHDYRYPIIGRLVENWLAKHDTVAKEKK